jgi:hypothetical protein
LLMMVSLGFAIALPPVGWNILWPTAPACNENVAPQQKIR